MNFKKGRRGSSWNAGPKHSTWKTGPAAPVEKCPNCGGKKWLMPLSYDESGVPCPRCNKDGKAE